MDGVSFAVEQGEIFGILGPNGAGKTTTVECVEGLRRPDAGDHPGVRPRPAARPGELRQLLGAQLQESQLPDKLRVGEAMELYSSFYRDPADWRSCSTCWDSAGKRDTQFRRLSGGQKQRLSIALALVGKPRVAVLDELTTGLDPQARRDTWELIERHPRPGRDDPAGHPLHGGGRAALRPRRRDRRAAGWSPWTAPPGLVSTVDDTQRIRFRPSAPMDHALLTALPEVSAVERAGGQLVVTGTGNLLHAVTSVLARNQVVAADLRVEQTTLDDAFVALTGRPIDN